MNARRIATSLLVLVVLVAVGYWAYDRYLAPVEEGEETAVSTETQIIDTGVDVISAEGRIVPRREARLAFQAGGRVSELLVTEGARVTVGQPLIRLAAPELEAAVAQAEAAVAQAEAAVVQAEIRIETLQVGVQAGEIGIQAAEAQLDLLTSEPLTQEIATLQENIAVAQAVINQSAAARDVTLSGASEAQLAAAEAQLAAAEAEERSLQIQYNFILLKKIGGPEEEITRKALEAAEASVDAAQAALNELLGGPTEQQQWAANATVAVAIAQRDAAQAQLALLLAGPKPDQVILAEVAVDQAEVALRQAEAAVVEAEAAVSQAEAGLAQAQAGLLAAEAALEQMTLTAPFAGTVARLDLEPGEVVAPGVPVITLADLSRWLVETTDLTELDVVAVTPGASVEIRVDAIPGETLAGTIMDIDRVSALTRGDVTYGVTIELDETADLPLRWGMTVFIDVDNKMLTNP